MEKTKLEIPPPRGDRLQVLGVRLSVNDLRWIQDHQGLERFRENVESTVMNLEDAELAGRWRGLIADLDRLSKEIRIRVYELLLEKIPEARFWELIRDEYEFDRDTFLALLDSHARHFFILIPEIGEQAAQYDRTLEAFAQANAELAEALHRSRPDMEGAPDARRIVIGLTLNRLKNQQKEENHVE